LRFCDIAPILLGLMAKIAVIETGGKQYVVKENDVLSVEKLPNAGKPGDKITFDKVLLFDDGKSAKVGTPHITGVKVSGELVEEGKGKKISVLRFRAKSNYKKAYGHRQPYSKVKITSIA